MSRLIPIALAVSSAAAACSSPSPAGRSREPEAGPSVAAPPRAGVVREVVFEGMCDASGAVELTPGTFVAADDEDNLLRIFDADRGGPALAAVDVSVGVGLQPRGKKRPKMPELDLEAATRLGERAFWLTSHGRNSKGKPREERLRFFATTIPAAAATLEVAGVAYEHLLDDLIADPRLARFGLEQAATRAPKEPGGLNLEGMTATPAGTLLLGFRNPVPDGRALLIELENPVEVIEQRARARFGAPRQLDLGGLGVRALTWWGGRYLIVAGPVTSGGTSRLFGWDGVAAEATPLEVDLTGYNPEGTFTPDRREVVMLLSDDGERPHDGVPCKELPGPGARRFRGVWVRI